MAASGKVTLAGLAVQPKTRTGALWLIAKGFSKAACELAL